MGYDYSFEGAFPDAMEGIAEGAFVGVAGIVTGIILIIWLLSMAFVIVSYVLNAVGMYRIAKRRGIHHAWLAWIPVGCNWLLGSISDHYQYVVKHKATKRRRVLLVLNIILLVVSAGLWLGAILSNVMTMDTTGGILAVALFMICYLAILGLSLAVMVFYYIAIFDLFRSCKPKYDVLFLVLGIFFNVTLPFFLFACSGSDEGMPARRIPQPPVQIPCQPEAPAQEEIPVVETEIVEDAE